MRLQQTESFAHRLAVFLRRTPDLWRDRRTDEFRPFDIHLAEHDLTLEGTIRCVLLDHFLEQYDDVVIPIANDNASDDGDEVEVEVEDAVLPFEVESGTEFDVVIPVARLPKRLFLGLTISDGSGPLPLISRTDDARIEADHLVEVLTSNVEDDQEFDDKLDDLIDLLKIIAFQNPSELLPRFASWYSDQESHDPTLVLSDWVRREGNFSVPTLGDYLVVSLRDEILRASSWLVFDGPPPPTHLSIPSGNRASELYYFRDLLSLVLISIRDAIHPASSS